MLFRHKSVQTTLTEVIADPHAPEHAWLAACDALGDEELITGDKPVNSVWLVLGKFLSIAALVAGSTCSWLLVMFAVSLGASLANIDEDLANKLIPLEFGISLAVIGTLAFWQRFDSGEGERKMRTIGCLFAVYLMLYSFGVLSLSLSFGNTMVSLGVILCFFSMNARASAARKGAAGSYLGVKRNQALMARLEQNEISAPLAAKDSHD